MNRIIILIFFISIIFIPSCGNENNACNNHDFDEKAMLENMADVVVVPAFSIVRNFAGSLDSAIQAFCNEPSIASLFNAKVAFWALYEEWQKAEQFNFGPSEDIQLNSKINNFPVSEVLLEANVSAGSYDLEAPNNFYSGLPALDYLLFGLAETEDLIIEKYTNDPLSENYQQYLKDVMQSVLNNITTVHNEWEQNYRDVFVNNTGRADGSSLSLLINSLSQNYERTRRERLGIPSGLQDIELDAIPDAVEGYHSRHSLNLLKANINATKRFFTGWTGQGLDDYLNTIDARKEQELLATIINQNFDNILAVLNNIPEPLSESIVNSPQLVQDAYVPMANQLIYLKTDMPSALCVSITYVDNASDSD